MSLLSPEQPSLAGQLVVLVAGEAPDGDLAVEVEEAVAALARAVFAAQGRLAVVGGEEVATLAALTAGEYIATAPAEHEIEPLFEARERRVGPPVPSVIYWTTGPIRPQARREEPSAEEAERGEPGRFPAEWSALDVLENLGRLILRPWRGRESYSEFQAERPAMAVLVGGTPALLENLTMLREILGTDRIYALASTGGAAQIAARQFEVQAPDLRLEDAMGPLRARLRRESLGEASTERVFEEDEERDVPRLLPYPLIMQTIVEDIAQRDDQ